MLDSLTFEFAAQESVNDFLKSIGMSGWDDSSLQLVKKLSENEDSDVNLQMITHQIDDLDLIISSKKAWFDEDNE